jgi:hypothetical protein
VPLDDLVNAEPRKWLSLTRHEQGDGQSLQSDDSGQVFVCIAAATIVALSLFSCTRLFECIGVGRKKGSPRDYDAESGSQLRNLI